LLKLMRSRSLENVAVWVDESGTGGGYSMRALRTLVVEDDAMIGGLLAETLEGLGHTVCAVESNVTNAVAAASRWRPDLIIVDVGLSEASGVAAVKEIVRIKFVPHVFVTSDAVRSTPLGPKSVLIQKPFRVPDLEQAIQEALAAAQACDRVAVRSEKDGLAI
jgi:CheY-like chemotaxis protein